MAIGQHSHALRRKANRPLNRRTEIRKRIQNHRLQTTTSKYETAGSVRCLPLLDLGMVAAHHRLEIAEGLQAAAILTGFRWRIGMMMFPPRRPLNRHIHRNDL